MITITVLGSGHVAHHLILNILKHDSLTLQQIYARNPQQVTIPEVKHLVTSCMDQLEPADLFILAVSDNAITGVSSELSLKDQLVVHTSGNTPISSIDSKNRSGVFYMLQSFSKDKDVDFSQIPIAIEATESSDKQLLQTLALLFTNKVYSMDTTQRQAMHLAAVFANNFSNHMFVLAKEICDQHQIDFEILKPLILETAKKVQALDPSLAQTGPAVRSDSQTIERHLGLLDPGLTQDIYNLITKSIQSK